MHKTWCCCRTRGNFLIWAHKMHEKALHYLYLHEKLNISFITFLSTVHRTFPVFINSSSCAHASLLFSCTDDVEEKFKKFIKTTEKWVLNTFNWVFAHSSDKRESWRGKFYQHHSRRRHVVTSPSLCLKLCLLTRVIKIASGAAARVKWVKSLVWKWNSISQFLVGFTFRRCGERKVAEINCFHFHVKLSTAKTFFTLMRKVIMKSRKERKKCCQILA